MIKNKKWKVFFITIISLFVLTLTACGGTEKSSTEKKSSGASGKDGEPIELVINSWFPSNADIPNNVEKPWAKYIEEKTEGKVKVKIHYNGALASSKEILDGVQSGLFDVGLAMAFNFADSSLFPLTIGDLPFAAEDPEQFSAIIQEFSSEYEKEIWGDVVKVGVGSPPPLHIYSTDPIKDANYLKGKSARVANDYEALFIKNLGGNPTQVAYEELYNSLDKGMIQSVFNTHDVYTNLQLAEVAPYYLEQGIKFATTTALMNKDFFNSLPEDLQTLFVEDIFPKWEELLNENARIIMKHDGDVKKMVEEKGGEASSFSDEELRKLKAKAAPVWDLWVENANKKGYPGNEMLQRYIEISKKHGVELDFLKK